MRQAIPDHRPWRLRRLAAVALALLLLGQAAVLVHAATDEHDIGDFCALCAAGDRLDQGAVPAPVTADESSPPADGPFPVLLPRAFSPAGIPLPRGPPLP